MRPFWSRERWSTDRCSHWPSLLSHRWWHQQHRPTTSPGRVSSIRRRCRARSVQTHTRWTCCEKTRRQRNTGLTTRQGRSSALGTVCGMWRTMNHGDCSWSIRTETQWDSWKGIKERPASNSHPRIFSRITNAAGADSQSIARDWESVMSSSDGRFIPSDEQPGERCSSTPWLQPTKEHQSNAASWASKWIEPKTIEMPFATVLRDESKLRADLKDRNLIDENNLLVSFKFNIGAPSVAIG